MNRSTDHPLSCTGRKLAYSSFHTYQQIPKNVDVQNLEEAVKLQVLHCSNSFREQLRVAAADISKVAESLAETADLSLGNQTSFEQDYDALFSIEKSWQICEIFCLNPTKLISIELIKWLKDLCFQVPLESYVAQFQAADEPESLMTSSSFSSGGTAMGYWDLVCQLVMQGNLVAAESMLSVHSEIASALAGEVDGRGMLRISDVVASSSNAITRVQCETLLDLLRSHPFAGLVTVNAAFAAGTSVPTNLVQEFTAWQNRVRKFRQSKVAILAVIPELDTVLRILLGDSSTLEHHSELPAGGEGGWGWAKQVIALLLYVYPPPLNKTDLSRVVEECMHKEADSGMSGNSLSHGYIATLREVMVGNIGPMLRSLYQMTLSASPYRSYLGVTPLLCTAHLCLLLVTGAGKEDLLIPLADGPNETSFFEEVFLEVAYRLHSLEFPVEVVLSYLTVCPMRGKEYARVLLPRSSMSSDRSVLTVATTMRESLDLPQEAATVLIARGAWWSKRGNAAKAAYFYQEAADEARLAGLLEASLRRCMHAVVACHSAFPGLSLAPCGVTTTVQDRTETAQSSDTGMQELENALVEAEELLMTVDSDAAPAGGSILSLLRKSLGVYVQVIQDRFATSASSLRGAVQRLAALLIDTPSGPILPIRYWLHTLELVAWYTNCISGLESAGSIDATSTASAGDDMQVDDAVDMSSSTATPSSARRPVFRKDQAYALLARLKEVTTSYGATTQLIGTGSSDALQSLHLSLMGVLCRSAIKENTLLGAQKAGVGHVTNKVGYSKRFAFEGRGGRHVHGWQGLTGRGFDNTSAECSLQRAEVYEILTGSSIDYGSL